MGQLENKGISRFDDRREYNDGPSDETEERRIVHRRENDKYRADLKSVLDLEKEDTVTEDEVKKILEPILDDIKDGKFN